MKKLWKHFKFAFWFFRLAWNFQDEEDFIVSSVIVRYKDELPMAANMHMFWNWLMTSKSTTMQYKDGKIIVTFERV